MMTLNQVALLAKNLIREPASGSISVALMEDYIKLTYYDWCQELQWPEGTFTQNTVANTQEYQLPETLNVIFRVYVNGQRIPATTIPLQEGDVRQVYDPTWRVLPSMEVPALAAPGAFIPITTGNEWVTRMQYYLRGGRLGLIPKTAAIYELKIEAAVFPPDPLSAEALALPTQFRDGLAYGGCYRFRLSEGKLDEAQAFKQLEDVEWGKAMRWRRRLAGTDQLPIIQPQPYREFFQRDRGRIRGA